MWACAKGHLETAIVLYRWNHNAINVKNNRQQNCLILAKLNGYIKKSKKI